MEEPLDIDYMILRQDDIGLAANLAARAFIKNPLYCEIYREIIDDSSRLIELEWLFEINIRLIFNKEPEALRCAYSSKDKKLLCFFMFPTNDTAITLLDKVWAGLLLIPFRVGLAAMHRLLKVADFHDNSMDIIAGERQYISLQRMVVCPEWQGRGIGSKCLGELIDL